MKYETLIKAIREEVRGVIKEELQEMLNEAVRIASTPVGEQIHDTRKNLKSTPNKNVTDISAVNITEDNPLSAIMEDIRAQMTPSEASNLLWNTTKEGGTNSVARSRAYELGMTGPEPGVDISALSFVKKAKEVLDLANKKEKERFN